METRDAEMTPVSYPKQKPEMAAVKDRNCTKPDNWKTAPSAGRKYGGE